MSKKNNLELELNFEMRQIETKITEIQKRLLNENYRNSWKYFK